MKRIALVTDFGGTGPYVGQLRAVLHNLVPAIPVIDLISDLPPFHPEFAAYLLPALIRDLPSDTLYLCVVDPGVGGDRQALILQTEKGTFIGPDNGLLTLVARAFPDARLHVVHWRPARLSASFHGRDLFAPIAAKLLLGEALETAEIDRSQIVGADWPEDCQRIIYSDRYGNLMTGLRASQLDSAIQIQIIAHQLRFARTFCEVPVGQGFWYKNSFGLVELAVNQGRADQVLGVRTGDVFSLSG